MKLSARTVCHTYGKSLPTFFFSARKGKVFRVFDNALWVRIEGRLIMIASDMRLFSPFSLMVPDHVLANLQMELTLGEVCFINAGKNSLYFEAAGQTLQIAARWRIDPDTELPKKNSNFIKNIEVRPLTVILLKFLKKSRKDWEWCQIWNLSFLSYRPNTLSEFILSLVLSFGTTSGDPNAELGMKWETLSQLEDYVSDILKEGGLTVTNLSSFRDQWEFKGALYSYFLNELLNTEESYKFTISTQSVWLRPAECFLLGYLLGMLPFSSKKDPLSKQGDFMALSTYIWGPGEGQTSIIFKEIFYYLSQGQSWPSIENFMDLNEPISYSHLLSNLEEVSLPPSPFGLELILGLVCRLLHEDFYREKIVSPPKREQRIKSPLLGSKS